MSTATENQMSLLVGTTTTILAIIMALVTTTNDIIKETKAEYLTVDFLTTIQEEITEKQREEGIILEVIIEITTPTLILAEVSIEVIVTEETMVA